MCYSHKLDLEDKEEKRQSENGCLFYIKFKNYHNLFKNYNREKCRIMYVIVNTQKILGGLKG